MFSPRLIQHEEDIKIIDEIRKEDRQLKLGIDSVTLQDITPHTQQQWMSTQIKLFVRVRSVIVFFCKVKFSIWT